MTDSAQVEGTEPGPEWPEALALEALAGAPPADEREATCPFPGPRSFKDSETEFFVGRADEARDLLSLVVSRPITLLYSPSGAGKTSLVQTKLAELMQEREYKVLPIARVGGSAANEAKNPYVCSVLQYWGGKSEGDLASFTGSLARAVDRDGDPTLRIAVIDQFEELFTTHRANFGARREFFEQLAEAIAQNSDLRVLLLLREEYLAALDRYAPIVPGSLNAKMRLERLSEPAAKAALLAPLLKRGIAVSDQAATYICGRLRTVHEDSGSDALGEFIEPVQLQVVCRRLWFRLPVGAKRVGVQDVSTDLGDVRAALITFYEDALKKTSSATGMREQKIRNWIRATLVTESRTRGNAFRGLYATEGMDNVVVDELDKQLIVRWEPRAGGKWYELAHDALIEPILAANATASAKQVAFLRRLFLTIALPLVIVVALLAWEKAVSTPAIDPESNAELASDFWKPRAQTDAAAIRERAAILAKFSHLPAPPLESLFPPAAVDPDSGAPIAIRLRFKSGTLDAGRLQREWQLRATVLERKGYAAPSSLQLQGDEHATASEIAVELVRNDSNAQTSLNQSGGKEAAPEKTTPNTSGREQRKGRPARAQPTIKPASSQIPATTSGVGADDDSTSSAPGAPTTRAALLTAPLQVRVWEDSGPVLMGALPPELTAPILPLHPVDTADPQKKIWAGIPAWSWPVLAARPGLLRPPEALVVDQLYTAIASQKPELFIAEPWLPHLLKHVMARKIQARSAKELTAAWGQFACPAALLSALNRTVQGFATFPDAEALFDETVARETALLAKETPIKSNAIHADRPPPLCHSGGGWSSVNAAVKNDELLVPTGGPIRVALGTELARAVTAGDGLRDELVENLDEAMQGVFERSGLIVPPLLTTDNHLQPNQLRIDTLEEVPLEWDSTPLLATSDTAIERISESLTSRFAADPARWIDLAAAEELERNSLAAGHPRLDVWSPAETVRILQDVVSPPAKPPSNCPIAVAPGAGTRLAEPALLLPTLAIWRAVSADPACATSGLRAIVARSSGAPGSDLPPLQPSANDAGAPTSEAATLLLDGRPAEAVDAFTRALKTQRPAAIERFIDSYAEAMNVRALSSSLADVCAIAPRSRLAKLTRAQRYEVWTLSHDARLSEESRRRFALCALQSFGELEFNRRAQKLIGALDDSLKENPAPWSGKEKAALAYWRLDTALPRASVPEIFELPQPPKLDFQLLDRATDSLARSAAELAPSDAFFLIEDAWSNCATSGRTTRFCLALHSKFGDSVANSFYVALNASLTLAERSYDQETELAATTQIEHAEQHREALTPGLQTMLKFIRLEAGEWRWSALDRPALAKVEDDLWERAKQQRMHPLADGMEVKYLAEAAVLAAGYSQDPKRIGNAIRQARALAPEADETWDLEEFKLALWTADSARTTALIKQRLGGNIADPSNRWTVPLALTAALMPEALNGRQLQGAGTSSEYPIHAELLAAYARGRTRDEQLSELKPTWEKIKFDTWSARLAERDPTVWGEVLLGDFMGDQRARALLDVFERSAADSPLLKLGMTASQLRCELYFYRALRMRVDPAVSEAEVKQALKRVLDTREARYYEFAAAKFLLSN